jgi:hypothetical protein
VPVAVEDGRATTTATATPPPAEPLVGRVAKKKRPSLALEEQLPPPWLQAFRMQVAAQSTGLASCFQGVERPGALRWTTTVHAQEGTVSDHKFESILQSISVTTAQTACLEKKVQAVRYKLAGDTSPLPRRVSLILEF